MSKGKLIPCNDALDRIQPLLAALGSTAQIAGSLRRGKEMVRDADIVIAEPVNMKTLRKMRKLRVLEAGDEKIRVRVNGFQADIVVTDPEHHGAAWLYLTGPREFNLAMRSRAKEAGFKLNQRGLWKDDKLIASRTEKEIFAALGLKFIFATQRDKCRFVTAGADWVEKIQGSAKEPYEVTYKDGHYRCTCPGFSFHRYVNPMGVERNWCKHIDIALERRGLDNPMLVRNLIPRKRKKGKKSKKAA